MLSRNNLQSVQGLERAQLPPGPQQKGQHLSHVCSGSPGLRADSRPGRRLGDIFVMMSSSACYIAPLTLPSAGSSTELFN